METNNIYKGVGIPNIPKTRIPPKPPLPPKKEDFSDTEISNINNFYFRVEEDIHDDRFLKLYWGTDRNGSIMIFPKCKLKELESVIKNFKNQV